MALCCLAALNVWDKVEESGKMSESLAKIIQGQKKKDFHWLFFLQRLIAAVNTRVTDPKVRQILIESLTFGNANSEGKIVIRPYMAKSAQL